MLKKMLMVALALAVVTPAFGYQVTGTWNSLHSKLEFNKDDDGNVIGWKDAPSNDRTVDWESNGDYTQRKAEVWNWPATYDYVPVCNIPVKMEIGIWIQMKGCRDKVMKMKQIAVNKYRGEVDCQVSANVATEWAADWTKTHSLPANKDYIRVSDTSGKTGDGTLKFTDKVADKTIYIVLGLKEVNLGNVAPTGDCIDIGYMTVKVRPSVKPNQFMSGCSGSGAGWGSTDYQYYAPPQP